MPPSPDTRLYSRPRSDFDDIFASGLSTVAIYMASLTSVEVWRALRLYDSLTSRIGNYEPKQQIGLQRALSIFVALCLFVVECLILYWALMNSIAGVQWGTTFLYIFFTWIGLSTLAIVSVSDMIISRLSDDIERNRPYSMRPAQMHIGRAFSATFASLGLAIYTALQPSSTVFLLTDIGLVFCLTTRPIFLMGNGWVSIRGAVYGCFVLLIFSWFTGMIYFFALGRFEDSQHSALSSELQQDWSTPILREFYWLVQMAMPFVNVAVGNLIALIFRYEFTVSGAAVAELYRPTGVSFEDRVTPSSSVAIINPGELAVVIARSTTPFHAPLFSTMISIHALVHLPALILTLSAYNAELRPDCGFTCSEHLIVNLLATTPPQVWALLIVPTLVLVASRTRDDGHNLWRYAERWVPPVVLASRNPKQRVTIGGARIIGR